MAPRSQGPLTPVPTGVPRARPRFSQRGLRAASVLFACAAAAGVSWLQLERGVYVTEVGEQRSIILEDGSNVELNARSRIRVRFAEHTRDVDLLEGQALFRVAADKMRPFTVRSGDTRVRAVGTQFDVYRKDSATTVSVVEGRVAVLLKEPPAVTPDGEQTGGTTEHPADLRAVDPVTLAGLGGETAGTKLLLSAGEQLVVTDKSAVRPSRADIPSATAWTQRQIVFHGSSLGEVVEQFNRYNRKQLVVEDPTLQTVRVSGVFSTTDPTSLLRFLHEQIQLVMTEKDGRILISRK